MVNLIELADFVRRNYEADTAEHNLITKYESQLNESWTNGCYYSGGQFRLGPKDEIKIPPQTDPYANACNSWECASICQSNMEITLITRLVSEHSTEVAQQS